jgi:hypothetical protein
LIRVRSRAYAIRVIGIMIYTGAVLQMTVGDFRRAARMGTEK